MSRIAPRSRRCAVRRGDDDGADPALPRHALPLRRARRRRPRHRPRGRGSRCRTAPPPVAAASMRIAIVGLPNAGKSTLFNALTSAGAADRRLPVHDDRAERRGRRRPGRAPRPDRRDGRQLLAGAGDDLLPRHRRAGQGGLGGRGPRQPVPGLDPRDRRDLPRRPLPRPRAACPTPTAASTRSATSRRSRPSCCSPTTSRPSAGSSGSTKQARSGEPEAVAERDWLEAVREALGAGRPARSDPGARGGARVGRGCSGR